MNNQPNEPHLPATDSTPRPGDFPLGSPASRAAARAVLERQEDDEEILYIFQPRFIGSPFVYESRQYASGRGRVRTGRRLPNGEIVWDTPDQKPDEERSRFWQALGIEDEAGPQS